MRNTIKRSLLLLFLMFILYNTYSQEKERKRIFDLSIDFTHNIGFLRDIRFEVYPNIGIKIIKINNLEIHSKIGTGLLMWTLEPDLISYQLFLESYYGKSKHFIVTGIGFMKVRTKKKGNSIPIIIGYRYTHDLKKSLSIQFNPLLWMTYRSCDGYGHCTQESNWIWENFSYTGYAIRLSYYYHF